MRTIANNRAKNIAAGKLGGILTGKSPAGTIGSGMDYRTGAPLS
jgi:hypothetical protein